MKKSIIKDNGSVYGGTDAWQVLERVISEMAPSKIIVITDYHTRKYCIPLLLQKINHIEDSHILSVPPGEEYKTIATCLDLWNQLSSLGMDRKGLIINLGGGVVTDLGGFVACTFQRGITFINIPTTLLAMVDASVGGKTGVDLGVLKNQVGVIQNPKAVLIETSFLNTLPKEQFTSGMAEMIKHGFITSEGYLRQCLQLDRANKKEVNDLVWQSIKIKNDVVTEDPYEHGARKTLNYGHTLGHAIESYCLKAPSRHILLHGEAIAIGMILATYISAEQLGFPKQILDTTTQEIIHLFGKENFDETDIEKIIGLLIFDKKNSHGNIHFVLLEKIGHPILNCTIDKQLILNAFEYYQNFNS